MFDKNTILRCFRSHIGFNQLYSDCDTELSERVTNSESGRYFSEFHALNETENLKNIAPNFDKFNTLSWATYVEFDSNITYNSGNLVISGNGTLLYESLQDNNTANTPLDAPESSAYWRFVKYKPTFENWIYQERDKAILQAVGRVFDRKQLHKFTKKTFADQYILTKTGRPLENDIPDNANLKFVGWRIQLSTYENLMLFLHKVGLKFTDSNTFTLFLFSVSQNQPIAEIEVQTDGAIKFEWLNLDTKIWKMAYASETYDRGEDFLLGYFQSDLTGVAVHERNYQCGCTYGYFDSARQNYERLTRQKFFDISPFEISNEHLNGRLLPDVGDNLENISPSTKTYGLNLLVSLECELSSFLCRHKSVFTSLIAYQFAINVMGQSSRLTDSMTGQKLSNQDFKDLTVDDFTNKVPDNLYMQYKESLGAVEFDMTGFKTPCLTCQKKGIRINSIM